MFRKSIIAGVVAGATLGAVPAYAAPPTFGVQKSDPYIWIQNKGEAVTITNVIANRGTCHTWFLRPSEPGFTPIQLSFGQTTRVEFWQKGQTTSLSDRCDIIELEIVTPSGNAVFTWK